MKQYSEVMFWVRERESNVGYLDLPEATTVDITVVN